MEKNLNELFEIKAAYEKIAKQTDGILNYYAQKKKQKTHNTIIVTLYTIFMIAVIGASVKILPVESATGWICLVGSIFAYGGGIALMVNNIKQEKKRLRTLYMEKYNIDIDELYINPVYLHGLEISKKIMN